MENPIDIYCNMCYNAVEVKNNIKLHNITILCGDYINTGKIFEQDKYFKKK